MKKLSLLAVLSCAAACSKSPLEGAFRLEISLADGQPANCVTVEVRGAGNVLLGSENIALDGRRALTVGLKQGTLPNDVSVLARGQVGGGTGCEAPLKPNGVSETRAATFPKNGKVDELDFTIAAPGSDVDADGDGYIAASLGGSDCNDTEPAIHPGQPQSCASGIDNDCNGTAGCRDPGCMGAAICTTPASSLGFATPSRSLPAYACSPPLTVQTRGELGTPAAVTRDTVVQLSADLQLPMFSDPQCTLPTTQVTVSAGTAEQSFYFAGNGPGSPNVTITSVGLGAATQQQTITNPPATQLVFTTAAQTVVAGECTAAFTVELRDARDLIVLAPEPLTVALSAPVPSRTSFYGPDCTTPITEVGIATGGSTATFFVKSLTAGMTPVSATATMLPASTQALQVDPAPPSALVFLNPALVVNADTCSPKLTVGVRDEHGNDTKVAAARVVRLESMPSAGVVFSPTTACGTAITQVTIDADAGSADFFFRGTTPGQLTVTASSPTPGPALTSASQVEMLNPNVPSQLVFVGTPANVVAGDCTAVSVGVRDSVLNPSGVGTPLPVDLSSNADGGFGFFSDMNCSAGQTQVTVMAGASEANLFFSATRAGTTTLAGAAPPAAMLTPASASTRVDARPASKLAFITPERSATSAICSAAITLQGRDTYDNVAEVAASVAVTVASTPMGVSSCAPVTFAANQSTVTFTARADVAQPYVLGVSAPGLGSAMQNFTVSPGMAARLDFFGLDGGNPAPIVAARCSERLQIRREDLQGNPVPGPGSFTLIAPANVGVGFHAVPDCSDPDLTTVSILDGGAIADVWATATRRGVHTLTARAASISQGSLELSVDAGAPSTLVALGNPQTIPALTCSAPVVIELQDGNGNPTLAVNDVTLTSTASGGPMVSFFDDMCMPATLRIAAGTSQTSIRYQGYPPGTAVMSFASSGLTSGGQNATFTAAAASSLTLTAANTTLEAGACQQVTVTRLDAQGNPTAPASAQPVGLSTGVPASAFVIYSDGACATPATSVTIASGQSAATFSVRGVTGRTQAYTLSTVVAGLGTGSVSFTVLPMVRRGSCDVVAGMSESVCALSPAIPNADLGRTFLIAQATTIDPSPGSGLVSCRLQVGSTAAAEVHCQRTGTTGLAKVEYQTVSFARPFAMGGASVQHFFDPVSAPPNGTREVSSMLAPNVDTARTFLLMSHHQSGNELGGDDLPTVRLTDASSTRAQVATTVSTWPAALKYSLQVVQLADATVTRGNGGTMTGGNLFSSVAVGGTNANAFTLFTSRNSDDNGGLEICSRRLRGSPPPDGGTNLEFTRGAGAMTAGCSSRDIEAIEYERVVLPPRHQVQRFVVEVADTMSQSSPVSLGTAVDATRAVVFSGTQGAGGQAGAETDFVTTDLIGSALGRHVLAPDGATFTVSRDVTQGRALFQSFVVQFEP